MRGKRRFSLELSSWAFLNAGIGLNVRKNKPRERELVQLRNAGEHLILYLKDELSSSDDLFFYKDTFERVVRERLGRRANNVRVVSYLLIFARRLYRMGSVDLSDYKALAREFGESRREKVIDILLALSREAVFDEQVELQRHRGGGRCYLAA